MIYQITLNKIHVLVDKMPYSYLAWLVGYSFNFLLFVLCFCAFFS